jgi:hypothetical protein
MSFLPEEENAMLKSIILIGVALALSVAACILPPVSIDEALAQSAPLYINAVDIDALYQANSTITWPR